MADADREAMARGYAIAALWTAGVDEMSGEYVPDEEKVAAIMPQAREAVQAFAHIVGRMWPDIPDERIGNCLHYDREGHGTGFTDEGDDYRNKRCAKIARMMAEDWEMQEALLTLFPDEAYVE